ncbi:MAG TPA: TetR/AcrR family transcriptional regulator [Balneolales bacterium]|nr:TetR/AcrR family transcriptional regulator [Balneolales bacterium]
MTERSDKWEQFMKSAILEGVVSVLTTEGADGLTMQRVAREAGVAKGTVYTYFENKEQLLKAALQASVEPLTSSLHAILDDQNQTVTEKLSQVIRITLTYFEEHRDTFRVLLHERHKLLGKKSYQKSSHYRKLIEHIGQVVSEGIAQGIIRSRDPQKIATMLLGATVFMIHNRLFTKDSGSLEDDHALVCTIFFQGIQTGAGQGLSDAGSL